MRTHTSHHDQLTTKVSLLKKKLRKYRLMLKATSKESKQSQLTKSTKLLKYSSFRFESYLNTGTDASHYMHTITTYM